MSASTPLSSEVRLASKRYRGYAKRYEMTPPHCIASWDTNFFLSSRSSGQRNLVSVCALSPFGLYILILPSLTRFRMCGM